MTPEVRTARIARLTNARIQLEHVLDTCDLASEDCGSCGALRYENFDDYTLAKKIQGMLDKIDGELGRLRR